MLEEEFSLLPLIPSSGRRGNNLGINIL